MPVVPGALDVVYLVRPGDNNEELRYSLRSVDQNFDHGRVWVVGYKPNWLTDVLHVPGNGSPYPQANVFRNVLSVCQHPDVPERFVLFNDDFFVTQPVAEMPVYYRGLLRDHLQLPTVRRQPRGWWARSLHLTMRCLTAAGIQDPLSYELHVPLPVDKADMAEVLVRYLSTSPHAPPQWRSLYGNLAQVGGTKGKDCKYQRRGPIATPFHSTDDGSWKLYFAPQFKHVFPSPSRYEKVT